jgi:hypothetical protein
VSGSAWRSQFYRIVQQALQIAPALAVALVCHGAAAMSRTDSHRLAPHAIAHRAALQGLFFPIHTYRSLIELNRVIVVTYGLMPVITALFPICAGRCAGRCAGLWPMGPVRILRQFPCLDVFLVCVGPRRPRVGAATRLFLHDMYVAGFAEARAATGESWRAWWLQALQCFMAGRCTFGGRWPSASDEQSGHWPEA